MTKRKPLKKRVSYRIARMRNDVFVRSDFADLGGYDQIGRCLRHSNAIFSTAFLQAITCFHEKYGE